MKGDIHLPNESGRVDPRIASLAYERNRRMPSTPTAPSAKPVSRVARVRENWRSFMSKGRR